MAALFDVGNGDADIMFVLHDGVAFFNVVESKLMPDGNIIENFDLQGLVPFHEPTGQCLTGFNTLDDHDADRVGLAVNKKMRCCQLILLWLQQLSKLVRLTRTR